MLHNWERQLIYDLALIATGSGEPIDTILAKHQITREQLKDRLRTDRNFYRAYVSMKERVEEEGEPFKLKARYLADAWLEDMQRILRDPTASASAKVDLFKHICGLAGYSAKPQEDLNDKSRVVINLNFQHRHESIDVTPTLSHVQDS